MKLLLIVSFLLTASLSFADTKNLLDANNELFTALLGEDQVKVEAAAKKLSGVVKTEQVPELTKTMSALNKISQKKSKADNIEQYVVFMNALIPHAKKQKLTSGYSFYFCPMVNKTWIQNDSTHKDVRNVYSQDMLECGEKVKGQ